MTEGRGRLSGTVPASRVETRRSTTRHRRVVATLSIGVAVVWGAHVTYTRQAGPGKITTPYADARPLVEIGPADLPPELARRPLVPSEPRRREEEFPTASADPVVGHYRGVRPDDRRARGTAAAA